MEIPDRDLTEKVIACAFAVHNDLGPGFLERVYENALAIELAEQGLQFQQQIRLTVYYRGREVGEYYADFLIENRLICELKAVITLSRQHEVQLVNYLAATGINTGLLINFGNSVNIRRKFRIYRDPVNREKPF
jgi:GxxExxY protein